MNVSYAKTEIKNTFIIYTKKDNQGDYMVPSIRQRPLLLMGPPGIGKTAVVAQAAQELDICFVSYTMTHHTRQSAVGLPLIREKEYDGKCYHVTEYTMSEIIGSVYDEMERTGRREGILFLDEINCVSETLSPALLQFLQCKTFGCHALPMGWMIVAAGNPPEYNKSVRDFDMVTLDRVKYMNITADYEAWKEYAVGQMIHSAILSYLDLKKDSFYRAERRPEGMLFVTARAWEDLSIMLYAYEELKIDVTSDFLGEYIQIPEIALDFKNYYDLYLKYKEYYHIHEILDGQIEPEQVERLKQAPFDEAVSVISLFLARLQESFQAYAKEDAITKELHQMLKGWKEQISGMKTAEQAIESYQKVLSALKEKAGQAVQYEVSTGRKSYLKNTYNLAQSYLSESVLAGASDADGVFSAVKNAFGRQIKIRENVAKKTVQELDHAFLFLEEAFHHSQEMVIFITGLAGRREAVSFIMEYGCEKFYQYNQDLLFHEKQKELQKQIREWKQIL